MNTRLPLIALLAALPTTAHAQDAEEKPPMRTRVALGPQLVPSYPGSDKLVLRPMVDVGRAREGDNYAYEAADESFGFPIITTGDFEFGPALSFEGERTAANVGAALPKVGFTTEVGALIRWRATDALQFRAEVRKGIGGHKGWVSNLGVDYVFRDGNDWLLAIGPRATLADARYHRAYFGVRPADSAASGLPAFTPKGGLQALGANIGYTKQFTPRWGIYTYGKYDRLVGDAARSPVIRQHGSRDQFSGGVGLTYTFGRGL